MRQSCRHVLHRPLTFGSALLLFPQRFQRSGPAVFPGSFHRQDLQRPLARRADRPIGVLRQRSKEEFEVQSGALTADECALAEQLFSADDVRVTYESQPDDADFDALRPILITDFTCEMAGLPEKPNTVKFTWRYATNRPTLTNSVADDIFTNAYNVTFK